MQEFQGRCGCFQALLSGKAMFGSQIPEETFDPKAFVHTCSRALESKYEIQRQLGAGAQGTAYLVQKKNSRAGDDSWFVAKESNDANNVDEFKEEYEKMRSLRHPNCLRVGICTEATNLAVDYITVENFFSIRIVRSYSIERAHSCRF